jgi:CheY-like chemotaxis protein
MDILYIDDETFYAMPFVAELERHGFKVHLNQIEPAIILMKGTMDFNAIVLDIMMPSPAGVLREATEDGMGTGLWFLREFKEHIISRTLPVLVFTNRNAEAVSMQVKEMNFPNGLVEVHSKLTISKQHLPQYVQKLANLWPCRKRV